MGMYFKDKTERITVRLTSEQIDYIDRMAKSLKCSRNQSVRFIIDTLRLGEKHYADKQADIDY